MNINNMKKILFHLLFALFFCRHSIATVVVTSADTLRMSEAICIDSAFGSLDTTRMSTKYLLDRVPAHFRPNAFNGIHSNKLLIS